MNRSLIVGALLVVLILALSALLLVAGARAHGDAEWIQFDEMKQGSAWCCGVHDCERAGQEQVIQLDHNHWRIVSTGQVFTRGQRGQFYSKDADYWWCRPDGKTVNCLFVPPEGT